MLTEEIKLVAETIKKLHSGDSISDDELKVTIKKISPTVELLFELGPKYFFVFKELNDDLNRLKDYQTARNGI